MKTAKLKSPLGPGQSGCVDGCCPTNQKVPGSIPGQVLGLVPSGTCRRQPIDVSLTSMFCFLPSLLAGINKKVGGRKSSGFKKTRNSPQFSVQPQAHVLCFPLQQIFLKDLSGSSIFRPVFSGSPQHQKCLFETTY